MPGLTGNLLSSIATEDAAPREHSLGANPTCDMTSEVFCSYCLRSREEAGFLVASPLAAICRGCAHNALQLLANAQEANAGEAVTPPAAVWDTLNDEDLLQRLPDVAKAGEQVESHLSTWVGAVRNRGISWARIGEALGMTRQSAWERFNA